MREVYDKNPLSYEEQLRLLISRGMQVGDQEAAIRCLESVSYYRLSGYSFLFRKRDVEGELLDQFQEGTRFEEIVQLYEFDRNLRLLIMDAIERVEIAVRTKLTYSFVHKYGSFGHLDYRNFHPDFDHINWLHKLFTETQRSRETFITHYGRKYEGFPRLPLWMTTEIMSLGSLSFFYKGLRNQQQVGIRDKQEIADTFNLHYVKLEYWLHTLTYIRNVCAHHSRLWNRELAIRPDRTREPEWSFPVTPRNDRIFYVLLILRYLLRSMGMGEQWHQEVSSLLDPIAVKRRYRAAMGIPENWKEHPIWK